MGGPNNSWSSLSVSHVTYSHAPSPHHLHVIPTSGKLGLVWGPRATALLLDRIQSQVTSIEAQDLGWGLRGLHSSEMSPLHLGRLGGLEVTSRREADSLESN